MNIEDKVICIRDCHSTGSARSIKKGEELIITCNNGDSLNKPTHIWFKDTPGGAGAYRVEDFDLLSNFKNNDYEIY